MYKRKERPPVGAERITRWICASILALAFSAAMPAAIASAGDPGRQAPADPWAAFQTRVFFAVFDCSWKNAKVGPTGPTTVRQLHDQLKALENGAFDRIHTEHVETDCARDNWFTHPDHGRPVLEDRLERMHELLAAQTELWLEQAPLAQISVVSMGGSWGATQAAEFSRTLHERGIRITLAGTESGPGDPLRSARVNATYRPSQAVILLDPVGTPASDLRLPPSVLSGVQIVAGDEERPLFRSIPIIPDGLSEDRRFVGITVAGSHSDICGGYKLNGFAIRTFNLVVDYINSLSDQPLLHKQTVPTDPALNVIHDSTQEVI